MKLFKCTDFEGHWPVGVAAIVMAETEEQARDLLAMDLKAQGLGEQDEFNLVEVSTNAAGVHILNDGNY